MTAHALRNFEIGNDFAFRWYSPSATDVNNPLKALSPSSNVLVVALFPERTAIDKLRNYPDNWDGYGSVKPDPLAIQHAAAVIDKLYEVAVSSEFAWARPHVTASEDGNVVFEWWNGAKKLTIYIGPDSADFIKVWGVDIVNEMSDGVLTKAAFKDLWSWLCS